VTGEVYLPGDDGYAEASTVYLRAGAPALAVRPSTVEDIAWAVRHAAEHGLVVSVRSGGHSGTGFGTNDDGLVIDLSSLGEIEVLDGSRVRIGGGALWGAVAAALGPHGLALSSGDASNVGVGGLTLGGGFGWLVRECGLTIDSLESATVVTADGGVVTASADENSDLYWAIRGGGGNFGVVADFTFRARELSGVHHGTISFETADLASLLKGWRDIMRVAPRELNTVVFISRSADGTVRPQVSVCFMGEDPDEAGRAFRPLLELEGAAGHTIEPKTYAEALVHAGPATDLTVVDHNAFVAEFTDGAIDALVRVHENIGRSAVKLRAIGGAFNEVAPDATAFAWRDSEVLYSWNVYLPPASADADVDAVRSAWLPLAEFTQGTYGNFSSLPAAEGAALIYPPETLARLRTIKRRYDPGNLFNQNHNILPAE
jgi:FAD/FMN-containing dehydrogenase